DLEGGGRQPGRTRPPGRKARSGVNALTTVRPPPAAHRPFPAEPDAGAASDRWGVFQRPPPAEAAPPSADLAGAGNAPRSPGRRRVRGVVATGVRRAGGLRADSIDPATFRPLLGDKKPGREPVPRPGGSR